MKDRMLNDIQKAIDSIIQRANKDRKKIDKDFRERYDDYINRLKQYSKDCDFERNRKYDLLVAVLYLIEDELDRVMWNINQKEYDSPFQNTGNVEGFKNDVFEVHAYDWNWDYEDDDTHQPINFKWKDLEITWYKHFRRGLWWNRDFSELELSIMLEQCLESLRKIDN